MTQEYIPKIRSPLVRESHVHYGTHLEYTADVCPPLGSKEHESLRSESRREIYEPLRI